MLLSQMQSPAGTAVLTNVCPTDCVCGWPLGHTARAG